MEDIGQALYEKIRARFERKLAGDRLAQKLLGEGAASMNDVATLAHILGYHLSDAIRGEIDQDALPDGRMYYNIAQSILEPTLHTNYELINKVADTVQYRLDGRSGVRIKPQHAPFPEERVKTVIGAASEPDIPFDKTLRRMASPAQNITQSFADDYMKANADFRSGAGFETYIVRTDDGDCCEWCSKMVGKYEYPESTPKDVFRRHDNCGCRVVYECGDMRQHVHSKRTWSDEEEAEYLKLSDEQKKAEREKRIALGNKYKGPLKPSSKQIDERIKEVQRRMDIKYGKVLDKSVRSGIIEERESLPRKIKKGSHAVNWSAVQSNEYSERIGKLSSDQKVSSAIETRAKWALSNRDGKTTEELYAISLNDGREIARITDQHYDSAVKRTEEFTRKLNEADIAGEKIILLHNHPKGLPPSINDINALRKNENVFGITVGHDGSIYRYTRPNDEIPEDDWNVALKHYKEFTTITSMEKALEILSKKYGFVIEKL